MATQGQTNPYLGLRSLESLQSCSDSKIVLELGDLTQEYLLSDFVTLSFVDGFFYAEGTNLSGEGSGYGLIGTRRIYPDVNFDLEIVDVEVGVGVGVGEPVE